MKFPAFEPINLKENIDAFYVEEICLSKITPDPNQPRKNFDESALKELAFSIKQHGVIQPIIVYRLDTGHYQIVAGERRWRASLIAELKVIPAIVKKNEIEENLAISLIENIQREELNPIELAESFYKLNKNYKLSHEAIATMVGKSRATITNLLRLLNLSKEVRDLLVSGKLEMGHARALLTLPPEQQTSLATKIVEDNLSVRDIERLVQFQREAKVKKPSPFSTQVDRWIRKLSHSLSSKVSININKKGEGKIIIHFKFPEKVDWLVDHFSNKINR